MATKDFEAMGTVSEDIPVLDWNDKIEDTGSDDEEFSLFRLLPEGDYDFKVDDLEYTNSKSGKNMVVVKIIIPQPEKDVHVNDRLVLTQNMQWKLAQFFKCLGLWEKAHTVGMPWDDTVGKTGRLHLKHRLYNGKEYNQVDKYLLPQENAVTKPEVPKAAW